MLERWKKQLFSEDGMKVVNVLFYSFVSGQKSPFYHMRLYCMVCIFGIFCQTYKE